MRTSAASARSIGRSWYLCIRSRSRGTSACSSGASATGWDVSKYHSTSWARQEKASRYIASVTTGQVLRSGSAKDCSVALQVSWWLSLRSIRATSGPLSSRMAATRASHEEVPELVSGALCEVRSATVGDADDDRDACT